MTTRDTPEAPLPALEVPGLAAADAIPQLEPLEPEPHLATATQPRAPLAEGVRLSDALRAGTRDVHALAEGTPFADDLLTGHVPVSGYADLLAQYHAVYSALEECSEQVRQDPHGAEVVLPELHRVAALESDLQAIVGSEWRDRYPIRPATQQYVARIREVAVTVGGYVAHAYTRYFGDLSGGQVIKAVLQRQHNLEDDAVAYLTFPSITRIKPFKDMYRARIDAVPLSPQVQAAVVAEARAAFEMNTVLLRQLGAEYCDGRGRTPSGTRSRRTV